MRPRALLLVIVTAMLALGIVAVQSAGMVVPRSASFSELLTSRTTQLGLAAVIAFLIARRIPPRWTTNQWVARGAMVIAGILLLLVFVPGIGREVNGARRWIEIGPLGFQPSEVAKWAAVLWVAAWGGQRGAKLGTFWKGLAPALLIVGIASGLVLLEDLGTALLIGAVAAILLLAAGARLWHLILIGLPALGVVTAAIISTPYRLTRLRAFLDPWADPSGDGYHVVQSMTALAGGGIGGRGLGNGVQKFGYLPEDTTDFIFSVICEEFGVLGGIVVVSLLLALAWTGWAIIQRQSAPHRQLLAMGIILTVTLQAIMNLMVVTAMAPTKGIALPLISSGGTGWIMTAFMIGLLASLDNDRNSSLDCAPRTMPQAAT
ncbi:MAG: FtsW/RodA/SpoVE family cell cycle protein [Phycisphaerales bacterium]|nr:FtsW/RodA/SpoVE family cell cycle protein [Phycisphaerales bacterium]